MALATPRSELRVFSSGKFFHVGRRSNHHKRRKQEALLVQLAQLLRQRRELRLVDCEAKQLILDWSSTRSQR